MKNSYSFLRKALLLMVVCAGSLLSFAQDPVEIGTRAELEAIATNLAGTYKLVADIDLTGTDWAPLGTDGAPFTGVLDGNGHMIIGMRFDYTANDGVVYPGGSRKMGLFSVISGGTVKNLGLKNAFAKGGKHVGGIAGTLKAGAVVEQCCVINSYIETADHGGSIVGNMEGQSIVRNCYGNGEVYSRGSQASGLVGMYKQNGTTISKSYFSGIVRSGNPSAIGAWNDGENPTCEFSVGLAPFVLGSSNLRVCVGNNSTMNGLYSLASTVTDGTKDNYAAIGYITNLGDSNYGANKRHGANIPDGDANALTQAFYETVLGWDFENVWKMPASGYPVLKWQNTTTIDMSVLVIRPMDKIIYPTNEALDLYKLVYVNNTLKSAANAVIDFTEESEFVEIVDGKAKMTAAGLAQTAPVEVTVNIVTKAGFNLVGSKTSFTIKLQPTFNLISTPEELMGMTDLTAAYQLQNDIDMTGIAFTRINEFKGLFDGNGHVIKGLTYNSPTNDDNGKNVGLFKTIRYATIRNLGLENVNFNGYNDVAGIVGQAYTLSVIENCYVSNSVIEGRDHVAAIAGALRDGAVIRNCYSNAKIHSREHQAGGISGIINWGSVYNSYFSGMVSNPQNRAVGIGGYQDNAGQSASNIRVENSVSLAPYLLSNSWSADAVRILHVAGVPGRPRTLANNYGLSTTWRGRLDFTAGAYVSQETEFIGADQINGADVSPADARTQNFYENVLGWDFTNTWKMSAGGFPLLKWQTAPVKAQLVYKQAEYLLEKDNTLGIDLTSVIQNTLGLPYTVTTESTGVLTIEGSVVKVAAGWNEMFSETVTVTISATGEGASMDPEVITLKIAPSATVADASLSGLGVEGAAIFPAFKADVYDYDVYVSDENESVNLTAVKSQAGAVITDEAAVTGVKAVAVGQNKFSYEVTSANGEFKKNYTLTVHRGLFSVTDLHGFGKRAVNVHSGQWNNNDESPYKLLLGKQAIPATDFNAFKWCHSDGAVTSPWVIFSFANIYEVNAVAFRDKNFREGGDGQIDIWKVEVSSNMETWTTVVDATGQAGVTFKYETFAPVQARYLRFTPTKNNSGAAWIYGFDIYGSYVGALDGETDPVVSRGKAILAYEGGYYEGKGRETPANILDGNHDSNPWATYNYPLSVDIDLESNVTVGGFNLVSDQQTGNLVRGYKVYLKETAEAEWGTAYDITTISVEPGIQSSFHKLPAGVPARFVRLEIPTEYKQDTPERLDAWTRIREFEVYDNKVYTSFENAVGNESRVWTAGSRIVVELNGAETGEMQVINTVGQRIHSQKVTASQNSTFRAFEKGVYLVMLTVDGKVQTSKVIVK